MFFKQSVAFLICPLANIKLIILIFNSIVIARFKKYLKVTEHRNDSKHLTESDHTRNDKIRIRRRMKNINYRVNIFYIVAISQAQHTRKSLNKH
jgi:hypothetical protein